ncbi:MAG: arsenate reductase ArsC [Thermodesulfobacteriota bacterium]
MSNLKKSILFLCTHNSARSQIAEALINRFFSDKYEAYSAGTKPTKLNPFAVKSMSEIGVGIESHYSKTVEEFERRHFNYVVTVCDNAREGCPVYQNTEMVLHKSFEDPSFFEGDDEQKFEKFNAVRDEIKKWLENTFT